MNYKPENLTPGAYFHIYNRGNNNSAIFFDYANYYFFLKLYRQYISPVAETYAWCLLTTHLHILVYIKKPEEICIEELRYSTVDKPRTVDAARQFSHLFNAYTQAVNKRYVRTGSLFENPFRRKQLETDMDIKDMIHYIHNNPLEHRHAKFITEYKWSSYNSILSDTPQLVNSKQVLSAFGGRAAFIDFHKQEQKLSKITKFIIE